MPASSSLAVRRVVSASPGRIRIRDRALRNPGRLAALEAVLAKREGILETSTNPGAGSLVLHFDPRRISIEALETLVDTTLDRLLATPAPTGNSRRRQINQLAKIGMLGSLATSLALLATGQKRGHAVAGALFVAGLGVHLSIYRRSIFR
jgi:hypothetical protein